MDYLNDFVHLIFSEYGAFVCFLILNNGILLGCIKILWTRVVDQDARLMGIVENNTKVMTQIVERLGD